MTKKLKLSSLEYFIILIFLGNFIFNLTKNQYSIPHFDLENLIFSLFIFLTLFFLGKSISITLNLGSISFSISIYLISFFAINFSFLFLNEIISDFNIFFLSTNILWVSLILISKSRRAILNLAYAVSSYIFLILIKEYVFTNLFKKIISGGDVEYFWFPMTKSIHDFGLFYSLQNNIEPGYGLLINYVHASLTKLVFIESSFQFSQSIPNTFIFLFLLFLLEQNFSKETKLTVSVLFISIICNSPWLSYLFVNSLMGESIVNLLFPIVILSVDNINLKLPIKKYVVYFLIGNLFLSKQFVSILILLFILSKSLRKKDSSILFFGFFAVIINNLNYNLILNQSTANNYLNSTELSQINTLRGLNIENIYQILRNLFLLDKVSSLFLLITLLFVIANIIKTKKIVELEILLIIAINFFLVFALYSSIWQDRELESGYRYIFSFYNLYLIYFGINLDKYKKSIRNFKSR